MSTGASERLRVEVYYDFASSLCYVGHRVMERMRPLLDELGIALDWKPLDLTELSHWKRGDEMWEPARANTQRVASELDVPLRIPRRWMDSRGAMAVALRLKGSDREPAWRERVWSAVFEEGRDLDEADELERLARDLDLDLPPLLDPRAIEAVEVATLLAAEADVLGVPTFMLDTWPVGGIQDERTMRSVFTRFARKKREATM